MSETRENKQIIYPDYELTTKIDELNTDIKYSTSFALGGLALSGGIVYASVSALTGKFDGSSAEVFAYPIGLATSGMISAVSAKQSFSLIRERHGLKKEQKQAVAQATEHYLENKELYQKDALQDAAKAGKPATGWHPITAE